MKWVKFTKHYQGGVKVGYELENDEDLSTDDYQQALMERWGEKTDGGHSYGYRVDMEILEADQLPPKEWLEKEVLSTERELGYLRSKIRRTEDLLKIYQDMLK